MGFLQIGNKVIVGGQVVAEATEQGEVTALLCDLCNEMIEYTEGFEMTSVNGSWQCKKCSAVN